MSEEDLRKEAVRRRRCGESAEEIAAALGRTDRWVRKWARAEEGRGSEAWAKGRSRAPHRSPTRTPQELRRLIVDARLRLESNPCAQYGALAVAWELRCVGVDPIPNRWTIEREIARAGLAIPRRRPSGYVPKGVLGHRNPVITQLFYQHAVPCLEEDAIARFAALVDGSKAA